MSPRNWARSLRTRLLVFLSIALLPLGVIAVFQTVQVIKETERLAQRDAVSRTAEAADDLQALLERAFGAAAALGQAAANLADAPALCSAIMTDFIDSQPDLVFAGFVAVDGTMTCTHTGKTVEFQDLTAWIEFVDNPGPVLKVDRTGTVSGQSVFIAIIPVFDTETDEFLGAQAISIPHSLSEMLFAEKEPGLDLALLSADGEILASSNGMDDIAAFERRRVVPNDLDVPRRGLLISAVEENSFDRPTALVPLVPGQIYALGIWAPGGMDAGVTAFNRTVPVFPLLMWLASLAVAYITVKNLILQPLSRLARQMRRYTADNPGGTFVSLPDAPVEITEIAESYNTLLDRVAADHARLEENVAEKETLLREVHHRVKNNLQLISSILNMQMRGVTDGSARRILSRVQDRVMSLSSVHRALYTDNQLRCVRADYLLDEIIKGITDLATSADNPVDIEIDLKPLTLDPDQAVPLSLLATEAMTNALKNVGTQDGSVPAIKISLEEIADGEVAFGVRNTCGPTGGEAAADANATGLGERLIASFASQLGGKLEIDHSDAAYDLRVRFEKLKVA